MTNQGKTDQVFRPRMDWWVLCIVLVYLLFLLAGIPFVLWYSDAPLAFSLPMAIFLAIGAVSLVDKTFYITYVLGEHDLQIHSPLRVFRVAYRAMDKIHFSGTRGLVTMGKKRRHALSRKNISISIRSGSIRTITVSPEEKDRFVHELMNRIESERTSRSVRKV
jgi:hypothetical protein